MIPWFHRNRKRIMEEDTWSCSHGNVSSSLKSLVNTHNEEIKNISIKYCRAPKSTAGILRLRKAWTTLLPTFTFPYLPICAAFFEFTFSSFHVLPLPESDPSISLHFTPPRNIYTENTTLNFVSQLATCHMLRNAVSS